MEAHSRDKRITRYRPPGVIPLELWDLLVDGRILWEVMEQPEFPSVLRLALERLRTGKGETRSEGPVPNVIAEFDSLYCAGGRSGETAIQRELNFLSIPVRFSPAGKYTGEIGGLSLLDQIGAGSGWLCDLGQTAFKICARSNRMHFRRDLRKLPIRTESQAQTIALQRGELRRWLSDCLHAFASTAPRPHVILFALPSRVDDAAIPEGSSYIGMGGDQSIVGAVMSSSGINPQQILVMNDAELAALDALADESLQRRSKTLVLTIGFGVGAAIALRRQTKERTDA